MSFENSSREYRRKFSHERVGRIIAGLFFIAGSLLGYFVHPLWLLVIGIGTAVNLILSGITDKCVVKNFLVWLGFPGERELGTLQAQANDRR